MPEVKEGQLGSLLRHLGACDEGTAWADGYGTAWKRAWDECGRGDWLLWIAAKIGVERQTIVLAACACARLSLPHVAAGEERPLQAIETAERWASGDESVSLVDVRAASYAARAAAHAAAHAAGDADAAAHAAHAAAHAAGDAAHAAARAAGDAAGAHAAAAARKEVLKQCADLVREHISYRTALAAWESRKDGAQ